jgi:hypothetical protein
MKNMKTFVKGFMVVAVAMAADVAQAQKVLQVNQLPQPAQAFIQKHFDAKNVAHVIEDDEFFSSKEYKVALANGTEIEFDSKGNWTEIDADREPLPQAIIPNSIRQYISKSFPNNEVVQISRSSRKYEVELSSGIDLEFDGKGNFKRIDD